MSAYSLVTVNNRKNQKDILQTAFKKGALQHYLEAMNPVLKEYSKKFAQQTEINVFPSIKELTLLLAGKVFFNLDFSDNLKHINEATFSLKSTPKSNKISYNLG